MARDALLRLAGTAARPRVGGSLLLASVLLAAVVVGLQQRAWTPAYTDYGQEGDLYTFPLNDRIGQEDGVTFYWARCGHIDFCGPIAMRGEPPWGASHVILKVPSHDPEARTTPLPEPVQAECSWRGDCRDVNQTTVTVTQAWGPYEQAPVRWQQAAVGAASALVAGTAANLARGPLAACRALLATLAGIVLASGLTLDFLGLYIFAFLLVLPALLVAGMLAFAGRLWSPLARMTEGMPPAILWMLAGWLVQSWLFVDWFPGPPTA